jgi:hypothetical protein
MSTPNDGGPAFPVIETPEFYAKHQGMTLRDWFAGKVMSGRCANATLLSNFENEGLPGERLPAVLAKQAYMIADAMLEARK